jgi:hypothetical protein
MLAAKDIDEYYSILNGGNDMSTATATKPLVGDEVQATIKGKVVKGWGGNIIQTPGGASSYVNAVDGVKITKRNMAEPTLRDAVVEVKTDLSDTYRYLKRADGWHFVGANRYDKTIDPTPSTWDDVLQAWPPSYGYEIKELTRPASPEGDYVKRDLKVNQRYTRVGGNYMNLRFNSEGALSIHDGYFLVKENEAIQLARDILAHHGLTS